MIGRSGERGSGISVLVGRHDDDDDDDNHSESLLLGIILNSCRCMTCQCNQSNYLHVGYN